jgi:uncharacterized protein YecE (DUF72 family)
VTLWIGTSGWQYKSWKGRFYPEDLPQKDWLDHYAQRFRTVEVNNTFYRLPKPETFESWRAGTPDDFVFVVKASRFLSHVKRLKDPDEPVERFLTHARPLGAKLGPVLVQLPPNLPCDLGLLRHFLDVWPARHRLTIEFRHRSWFDDEVLDLLRDRNIALSLTDRDGRPLEPLEATAPWGYVRMHHGRANPRPCYGDRALHSWLERIGDLWKRDDDVFVFFNNDPEGCAVRDAARFAELADRSGWNVTRTVDRGAVTVG